MLKFLLTIEKRLANPTDLVYNITTASYGIRTIQRILKDRHNTISQNRSDISIETRRISYFDDRWVFLKMSEMMNYHFWSNKVFFSYIKLIRRVWCNKKNKTQSICGQKPHLKPDSPNNQYKSWFDPSVRASFCSVDFTIHTNKSWTRLLRVKQQFDQIFSFKKVIKTFRCWNYWKTSND